MRKTLSPFPILPLLMLVLTGCTSSQRAAMVISNMEPIMEKMSIATNQNPDFQTVRQAMPASLVQLDGFIEAAPDNRDLLLRAAEAYSGYAFLFVEDTDKWRAVKLHKKARDYALRALMQNDDIPDPLNCSNDDFCQGLKKLTQDDVRALFFSTSSWLSYLGMGWKFDQSIVNDRPKVVAMMDRMMELDDTFNLGAIHVMFGSYYSGRPETHGGDLELALSHFEKAFEISDSRFLPWYYLFAKYYCVQTQDRDRFVSTLTMIINAPEDLLPEKAFANAATKAKAKKLLNQVDVFFEKDGAYLKKNLYL
jgi:tetratricopeptide (TPR) repeat protein